MARVGHRTPHGNIARAHSAVRPTGRFNGDVFPTNSAIHSVFWWAFRKCEKQADMHG